MGTRLARTYKTRIRQRARIDRREETTARKEIVYIAFVSASRAPPPRLKVNKKQRGGREDRGRCQEEWPEKPDRKRLVRCARTHTPPLYTWCTQTEARGSTKAEGDKSTGTLQFSPRGAIESKSKFERPESAAPRIWTVLIYCLRLQLPAPSFWLVLQRALWTEVSN